MSVPAARPLSLDKTREIICTCAPMCVEVFRYFQSKGGWAQLPPPVATFRTRLKIENYVLLYDNAQHIIVSVLLSYLGKDGLAALNREIASMSLADQEAALGEFLGSLDELDSELDQATEIIFSEKARKEAEARFASLSADEQAQVILSSQYFWSGFIAGFFNLLAVMVHGELLTDLVAKAKDGDEESFFKSVHIDHTIPFLSLVLSGPGRRETNPSSSGWPTELALQIPRGKFATRAYGLCLRRWRH